MAKVSALRKEESLPEVDIQEGQKIQENSVLLMLSMSMPGLNRSVAKANIADKEDDDADKFAVTIDADVDMIRVSKSILSSPQYKDVVSHANATKRALMRVGFRAIFKDGCFLVPVETISEVDMFLEGRIKEWSVLIEKFLAAYPKQKEEAKRLRKLYDESEYPTVGAMRAAFKFTKRYFTFDTPSSIKNFNKSVYEKSKAETERFWAETANQVNGALVKMVNDFIEAAISKFQSPDGKAKTFSDSYVKKLEQFWDVIEKRNMGHKVELNEVVNKARKITKGLDAEALKQPQVFKDVREQFELLKKDLDKMLIDKPTRKIRL